MAGNGLPSSGQRFRAGVIGVLILIGMVAMVVVALNAPKGLPFAPHAFRKVAIDNAGDLNVGNDVRFAQVRVGRVDEISLVNGEAVVRVQLDDPDRKIFKDARTTITSRSGLGQKYLDIHPGSPAAGELGEDEVLPVTRADNAVQLLDLADVFDPTTQVAARTALRELGGGMIGQGPGLHDFFTSAHQLLPDMGTVSNVLAKDNGRDFTGMLRSVERLSARFQGRQQQIGELEGQLGTTFAAFNVDNGGALAKTLDVAPWAFVHTRHALTDLQQPLRDSTAALTELEPGTKALGDATPDLRGFLRDSPRPLDKVDSFADPAVPALGDLKDVTDEAVPFAHKLHELAEHAGPLAQTLGPYSPEISKWFTYTASALSDGDEAGHWLRVTLHLAPESGAGAFGLKDPIQSAKQYPGPGNAAKHRQRAGVLENVLPGGNK